MSQEKKFFGRFPKWTIILLVMVLVSLLSVGIGVCCIYHANEYRVELTVTGELDMLLDYGQTYTEPGATAVGYGTFLKREHTPCPVTISGEVDGQTLGTYTVEYYAAFEDADAKAKRKVTVVDRQAPTIDLTADPEYFTLPGQSYQEEGFTASDNYDGDLTAQVKRAEANGVVVYTVSDSSGNQTQVTREIRYDDPEPPELTLKGKKEITITEGDSWKEPGYTAVDNIDGDITAKVTVSGEVNTKVPGTYQLTYQVSDGYENTVQLERTVKVKKKPVQQTGEKTIYLTFDDGPGKHTARLLEILKKYNVKATFFVCNSGYDELLDDMTAAGHTVAIHSYTHNYSKIYASEEAFYQDLYAMRDVILQKTGVDPVITRFPGGSSNRVSRQYCVGIMTQLAKSVQEKGFYYYDWTVDSDDAGGTKTTEGVVQNVIGGISASKRTNHFVLQHDIFGYSVDAVEQIIQWGQANGYTFKAITPDSPSCHHGIKN